MPLHIPPAIVDSRRLMGPNLYSSRMGAALEVSLDADRADALIDAWRHHARTLSVGLEWPEPEMHVRRLRVGASLFLSAPVDVLMTATEVTEQAWSFAEQWCNDGDTPDDVIRLALTRLEESATAERCAHSNLAVVYATAVERDVLATFDDEMLTLGSGTGARSWPLAAVPRVNEVPWSDISDVRIGLVTGSNGKTTTTRLVSAMLRAAGRSPGWCCSDGVWISGEQVEFGDYSGPVGARRVLRAPGVDAAVLESARGGMLRRGLAVSRADAAIITNIAEDHFGEYGVETLEGLTDAKSIVARVLSREGCLVLNADDPRLAPLAQQQTARIALFSASAEHAEVDAHVAGGGEAAVTSEARVMLHTQGRWHDLGHVVEMPITMRGAAPHNVENILGAALMASALGAPAEAIRSALSTFGASHGDNPGRLQRYEFGGVVVIVDYAHNPDGLAALCETALSIPAQRRLLLLGQAGNRDDEEIRDLARVAMRLLPLDYVIIKEELKLLRGRSAGDVPRLLSDELDKLGLPAESVEVTRDEVVAVRHAFAWARAGDLLVCPIHVDKAEVQEFLGKVARAGWTPGAPLPA
ncbi:Mur ligase family protein [soil metagenome]